ncbi:hypothetical protein GYMLUDRAFT_251845 [Collybiopsis luxurians FD-317 M1]|uniref:Uncharacterized protein n=1 Tax=Collybiopsis luxurians FD-317 M1 TaxID=944289 RepID=A0A0D0CA57_9AGAR|nr:hypothetical protein GYMLUDRAFT_251845 [Collybiopsis luxurians FD-317 M1]
MPNTPSSTRLPTGPPSSCGKVDVGGISLYGGLDNELADLNLPPNPSYPASHEGGPQPQPPAGATNNTPQIQSLSQHTPRHQGQYCPVPITIAEAPHIFKDLRKRQVLNSCQVEQLQKKP